MTCSSCSSAIFPVKLASLMRVVAALVAVDMGVMIMDLKRARSLERFVSILHGYIQDVSHIRNNVRYSTKIAR